MCLNFLYYMIFKKKVKKKKWICTFRINGLFFEYRILKNYFLEMNVSMKNKENKCLINFRISELKSLKPFSPKCLYI